MHSTFSLAYYFRFFLWAVLVFSFSGASFAQNEQAVPYILYWGNLEMRFSKNTEKNAYEAELRTNPNDFRMSIQREPRLWTGKDLLKNLDFSLEGTNLSCRSDQPNLYLAARPFLEQLAIKADGNMAYTLLFSTPDGLSATAKIRFVVENVADDEKTLWKKSRLMPSSLWGESLAALSAEREFLDYSGFRKALEAWFAHLRVLPLTSDREAVISVVPEPTTAYEIKLSRNIATDSMEQARLLKRLHAGAFSPGTQVFFQIRPPDAQVGDFLLFYMVQSDDLLLNRLKNERRTIGVQWGSLGFELPGLYAATFKSNNAIQRPADPPIRHEDKSLSQDALLTNLDAVPLLWEKGAATPVTRYSLALGDQVFTKKAQEPWPTSVRFALESAIRAGKTLTLQGLQTENADLSSVQILLSPK